jgi:hypothetical protein
VGRPSQSNWAMGAERGPATAQFFAERTLMTLPSTSQPPKNKSDFHHREFTSDRHDPVHRSAREHPSLNTVPLPIPVRCCRLGGGPGLWLARPLAAPATAPRGCGSGQDPPPPPPASPAPGPHGGPDPGQPWPRRRLVRRPATEMTRETASSRALCTSPLRHCRSGLVCEPMSQVPIGQTRAGLR